MRAARFARDAHPERKPEEVMTPEDRPRSWEELDCPDEIELELPGTCEVWDIWLTKNQLGVGDYSADQVYSLLDEFGLDIYVTGQAEDCWYAGVPRGRRLVLRRI